MDNQELQQFISNNANVFAEIDAVKKHLVESDLHHLENDKKIEQLFVLMDKNKDVRIHEVGFPERGDLRFFVKFFSQNLFPN